MSKKRKERSEFVLNDIKLQRKEKRKRQIKHPRKASFTRNLSAMNQYMERLTDSVSNKVYRFQFFDDRFVRATYCCHAKNKRNRNILADKNARVY